MSEYANTDRREPIRLSSIIDAVNNVILLACANVPVATSITVIMSRPQIDNESRRNGSYAGLTCAWLSL